MWKHYFTQKIFAKMMRFAGMCAEKPEWDIKRRKSDQKYVDKGVHKI
jgi:hypothetical protein